MAAFNVTHEQAVAALGGAQGGTSSVYFGGSKSTTKVAGRPGSPVTVVTGTSSNTLTQEEAYLKFWNDKATKAKVMARLNLMGRPELGEAGGYALWKDTVDQATEIYSSGKGYKITPYELLNLSAKQAAPAPTLPSRQITPLEKSSIYDLIDSIYLSKIGQLATEDEKKKLFDEFSKQNVGTTQVTKKVKNAAGVMENVTTSTQGFTQSKAAAQIEAKLKESNPLEYQRRKAFEFSDEMNKVLSGGM